MADKDPEGEAAVVPSDSARAAEHLLAIRRSLALLLLMLGLTLAYFARDLLLPIVLGILISLIFSPVVRGLWRVGLPVPLGALVVMLTLALTLSVGAYLISGPVIELADRAPQIAADIRWKLRGLLDSLAQVREVGEQVAEITGGDGDAATVIENRVDILSTLAGSAANVMTTLVAAFFLALLLLASDELFQRRLVEVSPRFEDKRRALAIARDIERQVSRYLGSITLINAGLGVAVGVALWLLGVPLAPAWGLAAFLLNFLPFIGALIGVASLAAVSLVTFDDLGFAFLPPLAYLALTTLEGNVVTPAMVGRRLEINTVAVFLTVMIWIWLWGVPGALLAVPFLVVIKVICDSVERLNPIGRFLAGG